MKKVMFLLVLTTTSLAWSQDTPKPPAKKEVLPIIPHVWISEGLSCLQAKEDKLAFANRSQDIHASHFADHSLIEPTFQWNKGLRIELGFQPKEQYYFANWSYIRNTASGKKNTAGSTGFFPVLSMDRHLTPDSYVTSARASWALYTQLADFGTMFPWRPTSYFLLKSHVGGRIASLNQTLKAYYGGGVFSDGTDVVKMRNNFLGIGPRIGIVPNFLLPAGFSLVGEFAAYGLLGRYSVRQKEEYLSQVLFSHTHIMGRWRWGLDAKVALAWQKELLYKAMVICAEIGWEWHEFLDQNQLRQNRFHLGSGNDNLFMQGGFASVCLAF